MDKSDAALAEWLEAQGLGQYTAALIANDVDLDILPELDAADLRELGFSLGHTRRLLRALREGAAGPRDDIVGDEGAGADGTPHAREPAAAVAGGGAG